MYLQADSLFYLPGDKCTWEVTAADAGKRTFIFAVDSSGVAPGAALYVYTDAFDSFRDAADTTVYSGFSPGLNNDLRKSGTAFRVTFDGGAAANATAAAGPRVTLQAVPNDKGMSATTLRRIIFSSVAGLIVAYLVLAYIAYRKFTHNARVTRRHEEEAARCVLRRLHMHAARTRQRRHGADQALNAQPACNSHAARCLMQCAFERTVCVTLQTRYVIWHGNRQIRDVCESLSVRMLQDCIANARRAAGAGSHPPGP